MSIKLWAYSFWSSVLIVGVVVHAFHLKQQFYPATLHLTNSKFCSLVCPTPPKRRAICLSERERLQVLGNFMLMMVILTANLMRKLFLGNLRELEIEHLTDRVWGTVMDTLLMTTIFRSEFNSSFISWFIILIFCKIFHWLAQDRVDFVCCASSLPLSLAATVGIMNVPLTSVPPTLTDAACASLDTYVCAHLPADDDSRTCGFCSPLSCSNRDLIERAKHDDALWL